MNETTKQKNISKTKQDIVFIGLYLVLIAGLVASAFVNFLNTGTDDIGLFDIISFSGVLKVAAILAMVLFFAMALTAVVCIVEKCLSFGKEKKSKIGSVLFLTNVVLLVVCLPGLISAQVHLLRYYQKATITFAFVTNLVLPLIFFTLLAADKKQFIKGELLCGVGKQKTGATTFVYPVLALIALVVFCLPVYTYQLADGSAGVYTELLSLYGATVYSSLLNFRASFLLIASAVLALAMCVVKLGSASAQHKQELGKANGYKKCIMVFAVAMLVVLIYCLPATINFMTECSQYIMGLPAEVYTGEKLGISYYAMLAVPVLIAVCCATDGVNEYLQMPVAKNKKVVESGNWQIIRTVFKSVYVAVLLVLLLSISLPYAKYGLFDLQNVDFFSFITLYSGVDKGYINGMPATNTMFIYALLTAVLAVASLVVSFVGQKSPGKRKSIVEMITKTVCMVAFIGVFAWLNGTTSFYYEKFAQAAQITGSYIEIGIAGDLLSVATIGYLVVACLDFVVYGAKFLQSRK